MTEDEFFRFDPKKHHFRTMNGEPVTEELINRLADVAERNGPPIGLIPGGKSLNGDGSKSPRVQVVLSKETEAEVRRRAAEEHMSVSRWIRRLIEKETA